MYVNAQTLITAGAVLTALVGFVTIAWKLFKWINHQKEQDQELRRIEEKFDEETKRIENKFDVITKSAEERREQEQSSILDEQTLIVYGLLACLKGLKEQGCNGPVTEAIGKIEKHINLQAHSHEKEVKR